MSKSLYEQFADIEQPKVLKQTKTFEEAVVSIRGLKTLLSAEYMEWAEEVVSRVFDRTYAEVRDAVDGVEPWISISGMYSK